MEVNNAALEPILAALVAATPEPPDSTTDPSEVLELAVEMLEIRTPMLDELREKLEHPHELSLQGACCLSALEEKNSRWEAALQRARHEIFLRLKTAKTFLR